MLNYVTKLSPLLTNPRFPCANVPRFPSTLVSNDTLASPKDLGLMGSRLGDYVDCQDVVHACRAGGWADREAEVESGD